MTISEAIKLLVARLDQQQLDDTEAEASTILRQWLENDCKMPRKDKFSPEQRKKGRRDPFSARRGIGVHSNADMFKGK